MKIYKNRGGTIMIRKFEVKNYKNFKDTLSIDFTNVHDYQYNEYCVKNGLINKMIIYGKNAVGKSNLGFALYDIAMDVHLSRNPYNYKNDRMLFKNADAEDEELVEFYYSFQFDDDIVDYSYKKKDVTDIVSESLHINDELIFSYNTITGEQDFSNTIKINASDLNWNDFIEISDASGQDFIESTKPSALRYIIYNTIQKESSIITKLSQFIKGMRFTPSLNSISPRLLLNEYFTDEESLLKFEKYLNNYGVKCKLKMIEGLDGKKDLYFDYKKPLLFSSNLSSGTIALTRFYIQYLSRVKPTFVFMDEFDAFYHFELSEKIISLLENEFDCQVILTSHNTNLLSNSIMRPDCFMILSNGKLTPICEATNRELRQGHNLEKLYKNGEFDE